MRLLLVLLLLATPAWAVPRSCQPPGTLAAAQTATGASADQLCINPSQGARSVVFTYITASGSVTVGLELSCDGTTWIPVANSSFTVTSSTPNGVGIDDPQCCYRANATANSGSLTVKFRCGPEIH